MYHISTISNVMRFCMRGLLKCQMSVPLFPFPPLLYISLCVCHACMIRCHYESYISLYVAISLTQPLAAYFVSCHGLLGKWTYLALTIPHSNELFIPLEDAIRLIFLLSWAHWSIKAHSMTRIKTCSHFKLGLGGVIIFKIIVATEQ